MADQWQQIDVNSRGSLTAVSSIDDTTIIKLTADPTTGRLLVDLPGGGNNFIYNEVVSGIGTTFTLAHTPVTGTQAVYANGQRLTPTVDYSITGTVITTVDSWATGQILADYQY